MRTNYSVKRKCLESFELKNAHRFSLLENTLRIVAIATVAMEEDPLQNTHENERCLELQLMDQVMHQIYEIRRWSHAFLSSFLEIGSFQSVSFIY